MASFTFSLFSFVELQSVGFPDSHFTLYDRAVNTPMMVLAGSLIAVGFGFLFLAARRHTARVLRIGVAVLIVATMGIVALKCAGFPWYFHHHLGLEAGEGG